MIASLFLAATNHLLAQSGWARQRLMAHAGRGARLDLTPLSISFAVSADGYLADWNGEDEPDVMLTLPLGEAPRVVHGGIGALMSQVRIAGNADFADALGSVFRHLRWDAEEDLARVVGDIAAHRLVDAGRSVVRAQRRLADNVAGNVAEYLTEEQPMLLSRAIASGFDRDIATLRDDVERLGKRIERLRTAAGNRA